ncbi:MAG: hypothetical protein MUQ30_06060 [Anaerolineae bacterium]|nr:hypothetical protein [Anaerolineae bacterium]
MLLRFPDTVCGYGDGALLSGLPVVTPDSGDESAVSAALSALRDAHGPAGALIYLHGQPTGESEVGNAPHTSVADAVRRPFILAKHLWSDLTAAAGAGWAGFFTVTRMDGALGTTGQLPGGARGLAAGGLAGLTKTLRLEWPTVACRAVDLAPELEPDQAAELLFGEICDPNRLVAEVGWGDRGRMTLEAGARQLPPGLEEAGHGA